MQEPEFVPILALPSDKGMLLSALGNDRYRFVVGDIAYEGALDEVKKHITNLGATKYAIDDNGSDAWWHDRFDDTE